MGLGKTAHRDSGHLLILEMEAEQPHRPSGSFLNLRTWGAQEWLPKIAFFLPFTPTSVRLNFTRKMCCEIFKNVIFSYMKTFLTESCYMRQKWHIFFCLFFHSLCSHNLHLLDIYLRHRAEDTKGMKSNFCLLWRLWLVLTSLCYIWNAFW